MNTRIRNLFLLPALIAGLGAMPAGQVAAQTFTNLNTGGYTAGGGLILSGNTLYGTTEVGGAYDDDGWHCWGGTVFAVNTDGTGFTNLHSFSCGDDGALPEAGLILSGSTLYGTALGGGTYGRGTVFAVNTDGTGFTTLHSFTGDSDGAGPVAGLILSGNTLYGTTSIGTVFKVNTDGTGFTTLYEGRDDVNIDSGVILSGNTLYGTSYSDSSGVVNVFAVNTDGTGFTNLYTIVEGAGFFGTGQHVEAFPNRSGLVLSGNILYGTTETSGQYGLGGVFAVNTDGTGFTDLYSFTAGNDGFAPIGGLILSGNTLYGTAFYSGTWGYEGGTVLGGTVFSVNTDGTGFTILHNGGNPTSSLILSGNTLYGESISGAFSLSLPPRITSFTPESALANGTAFELTIIGSGFNSGSTVYWDGSPRATTFVNFSQIGVSISAADIVSSTDIRTVLITVLNPDGQSSEPKAFTVVSANVGSVASGAANTGQTVTVQAPPTAPDSAGVTASLENSAGTAAATVTAATYTQNPTPAAVFDAGGGFVDVQVSGADPGDRLTASFYYPQTVTGASEASVTLMFFNGTAWISVLSSGGLASDKNTQDNLDGTVSGGRFQVVFDNTSTPQITELNGTVFAVAIPDTTPPTVSCPDITVPASVNLLVPVNYPAPTVHDNIDPAPRVTYSIPSGSGFRLGTTTVTCTAKDAAGNSAVTTFTVTRQPLGFEGFEEPLEGADATGGSFANPLQTFKMGSTVPVKFTASCGGSPVITGIHILQAVKYSDSTTAAAPIDATPQGAATTGNQFRLTGGQWIFNLDTKATGMSTGIWFLRATLSDGSQHGAWIQIK
jgi:uncharacterized repeat protein (TIGR03803 family)